MKSPANTGALRNGKVIIRRKPRATKTWTLSHNMPVWWVWRLRWRTGVCGSSRESSRWILEDSFGSQRDCWEFCHKWRSAPASRPGLSSCWSEASAGQTRALSAQQLSLIWLHLSMVCVRERFHYTCTCVTSSLTCSPEHTWVWMFGVETQTERYKLSTLF